MATVILFGGGDGGGLIITESGIRPIPPFDPGVRFSIKSAAAMVNAMVAMRDDRARRKMAKLATSLCNLAVEQVEEVVGPLDADRSLIYQDEDGGFTCGSTGKPPIPFPWPPRPLPSVHELVASGVVGADLVDLLRRARDEKVSLTDVFEDPLAFAGRLGVPVSERSAADLQLLAPSKLESIGDDVERDIVRFFHVVANDGRYLETWYSRPYEVSHALNFELSDAALERLVTGGAGAAFTNRGGDVAVSAIAAGIVWGIVCIVVGIVLGAAERPIDQIVVDRSGIAKI
jgi:hypothetical protein